MLYNRINNKAQNFVEYTIIISIVGIALFGMQTYFKRGIQSVIKVAADDFGPQGEPLFTKFKDDPKLYEEKRKDQEKIEAATMEAASKDKNYRGSKYYYTSTSSGDITIKNEGEGKIRRTTNQGSASSDDVSY